MKTILKIKFDNTFYLFLLIILLSGLFKEFTFIFILLFFHELGHAFMGLLFKWKITSITFYPYGGKTLFDTFENRSTKEEILILLAGPIMQIITYFILSIFFKYDYLKNYHLTILIFNLLPILSLDGGRLLNLILSYFFNYLTSYYITLFISIITTLILFLICLFNYHNLNLFLMTIFLTLKIIESLKNIKFYYQKFLVERYLYDFPFKKRKISKDIKSFYKDSKHYINFQKEKDYLNNFFQYKEKNRKKQKFFQKNEKT